MINPAKADIGKAVVYSPRHGREELGLITSFNDAVVFVRYGAEGDTWSRQVKATYRKDLFWPTKTNPIHDYKIL